MGRQYHNDNKRDSTSLAHKIVAASDKVLELLEKSILTQSLLTLVIWGTIVGLLTTNNLVPDELWAAGYSILGFFFGSKVAAAQVKDR